MNFKINQQKNTKNTIKNKNHLNNTPNAINDTILPAHKIPVIKIQLTPYTFNTIKISALIGLTLIAAYMFFTRPIKKTVTLPNNQKIKVEIADTIPKQSKGLMGRKKLNPNTGMLFVFRVPAKHMFWMKDTYIPLDIIWLDESKKIVTIKENLPPCIDKNDFQCQLYMPDAISKYVLELNAGEAAKNNLKVGDEISFNF